MIAAAIVTFTGLAMVASNMNPQTIRRIVGYKGYADVVLHLTIIILFHRTFEGLMQAEAAGIMVSASLRLYRWSHGYERYERGAATKRSAGVLGWVRYPGRFSNSFA